MNDSQLEKTLDTLEKIDAKKADADANLKGTLNVLEASKKAKVKKFIYAASASCYGIPEEYPTNEK